MTAAKEENHAATAPVSPELEGHHNVTDEEDLDFTVPEPPDGGWGWVVVFCSFMIHVIADGVAYTFGIFYVEFLKYYGESKGATSWVASLMVGITFCSGPIAGGLTNKFGCRVVTIVGSLLAAFGLIISTFAPSITFLYFSIGICAGTGFGLMYVPAIVCVTSYFEKKRAFATGIAVCGSGIGTSVMAPLIELMVSEWGWQGAMLVTAGLVLECCIFGALFRPLERNAAPRRMTLCSISSNHPPCNGNGFLRKGSLPNGTIGANGEVCLAPLRIENLRMHSASMLGINHQTKQSPQNYEIRNATSMTLSCGTTSSRRSSLRLRGGPLSKKDVFYSGNIPHDSSNLYIYDVQVEDTVNTEPETQKVSMKTRVVAFVCPPLLREVFREMTNFELLGNVIFLMFAFSNFFTNIGFNVPYVYTKDRALGLNIADETKASYLISIIGIANTVSRVVLGYLSDRSFINRLWLYNGSLTLCGFATVFSSLCNSYSLMGAYAIVFGATAGAYVSLTSVILVDLLGMQKMTNSFGLLLLFEGVACLIGPPITGWLHDHTGSYDPGFYASGLMIAISGLMLFFIPCIQRRIDKKEEKKEQQKEITLSPTHSESPVIDTPCKEV